MKNISVAIDGPAGAGKTTIAGILAKDLNLTKIDTGAMYRCVALKSINENVPISDEEKIIEIARNCKIEFLGEQVFLDDKDVTKEIRSKEVTDIVSPLSSIVEVRHILVKQQQEMANGKNVIMEGRDITTVVLPNASVKIYLDATESVRAKRRYDELKDKNNNITYEEILENIRKRDYNDMHKKEGSLIRTNDAIYIDSSDMTLDEVINRIKKIIGSEGYES